MCTILHTTKRNNNLNAAAREQLYADYEEIVKPMARILARKLPASFAVEDLEQMGRMGLWTATEAWDGARAATFRAYAKARVRGAMLDGVRGTAWREGTMGPLTHEPAADAAGAEAAVLQGEVMAAAARLPERRGVVIRMRYREGLTQAEVGAKLGVTQMRVSQLEKAALGAMRRTLLKTAA